MNAADLDALNRGLVEVGLTAAEALARIDALESALANLIVRVETMTEVEAIMRRAGYHPPPAPRPRKPRHLKAIRGSE